MPKEEQVVGIYNMLSSGEGRIPAVDIIAMCKELGFDDTERMVRLIKSLEGEVLSVHAELREKQNK